MASMIQDTVVYLFIGKICKINPAKDDIKFTFEMGKPYSLIIETSLHFVIGNCDKIENSLKKF